MKTIAVPGLFEVIGMPSGPSRPGPFPPGFRRRRPRVVNLVSGVDHVPVQAWVTAADRNQVLDRIG